MDERWVRSSPTSMKHDEKWCIDERQKIKVHPSSQIPSHWHLWSFWNASLQLKHGASQARTQERQKDQQHHGVSGRYRFSSTTRRVFSRASNNWDDLNPSYFIIKNYVWGKLSFWILWLWPTFLTHFVQYHLSSLLCCWLTHRSSDHPADKSPPCYAAKLKARISLSGVSGNADLRRLLSICSCNLANQMGWLTQCNWWDILPKQLVLDFDHQSTGCCVGQPNHTQLLWALLAIKSYHVYIVGFFPRCFSLWRFFYLELDHAWDLVVGVQARSWMLQ